MEPIDFSQIFKRAIEMPQDKALIYLVNTLDGVNGICFECLDELLSLHNYNFCSITSEIFNDQCRACSFLCHNEKDQGMIN
jgi:hypothetical protein